MCSSAVGRAVVASLCFLGSVLSAFAERELHVVGIYEGVNGGTAASVLVNRPSQSVTLFLSSYSAVNWTIAVGAGTTIERVFVTGYYHQTVQGLPADVPVTSTSYQDGSGYLLTGYSVDSSRFLRAVPKIAALTGQEIASFHGGYQPPAAGFTIDAVQNDPRLLSTYPQPVPLSQLPDLHFDLATYSSQLLIRHYGLNGPDDGGFLLDSGVVMDSEPTGRLYYGVNGSLIEVDTQGATRNIPLLPETVQEGWVMGSAFDRKRNRALVVTLSGEGFLYGYSPAASAWNLRTSLQNRDFDCITYHDADDSLYAVGLSHEDSYNSRVVKLTPDGAFVKEIALPVLPFDIEPGGHRSEIVSVGDYLVVLFTPGTYPHAEALPESRIYLVDPRTSEVWLTYRQSGPPNQRPIVVLQQPLDGAVVAPGSTVGLAAWANDPDGSIASVTFLVDGTIAVVGTREPLIGSFTASWTAPDGGSHTIVAKATDDKGATSTSAPSTIAVDHPPTIAITVPGKGGITVAVGSTTILTALATDSDGSIASVVFTANGRLLGSATRLPGTDSYTLAWTATAPGTFNIAATARDNQGATAADGPIPIVVTGPEIGSVKAIRFLPPYYVPGRRINVLLTARASSDVTSYSLVEHLPTGWTVDRLSGNGKFDPVTGTVTFGPVTDRRTRAFVYRATPPPTATGPQQFAGSVVLGGAQTPITGDGVVIEKPHGKPRFVIAGPPAPPPQP